MIAPGAFAAEGAWCDLVGPGRAIDTDRFFVVCPNALGSSYGSTGPASLDPHTGRPYGTAFPDITIGDMVRAQKRLLDHYGVTRLAAAVGPSMGGYQEFEWGVAYPHFVERVVAAVSSPWNLPSVTTVASLLATLEGVPAWRSGDYVDTPGSMRPFMTTLREAEIRRLATDWASVFDPTALLALTRACEWHDVRSRLPAMRAPLLYVNSRSDAAFPPALAPRVLPVLAAAGVATHYIELDSDKGHLASGADAALWSADLARFLDTPVN